MGRKERPYARPYARASFIAPVRTVDPYGRQESIFDTPKRRPYVQPVEDTRTIPEAVFT